MNTFGSCYTTALKMGSQTGPLTTIRMIVIMLCLMIVRHQAAVARYHRPEKQGIRLTLLRLPAGRIKPQHDANMDPTRIPATTST